MSRDSVLVSADWAEKNLGAPGVVFVEVDEDTTAYDAGHIPGAVKLDWKTGPAGPGPPGLRQQAAVRGAAVRARASPTTTRSILYGGNNNWFAAYAYWYFKLYGHGDVKLLDGGRKKWELDNRPLVTDAGLPPGHHVRRRRSRT